MKKLSFFALPLVILLALVAVLFLSGCTSQTPVCGDNVCTQIEQDPTSSYYCPSDCKIQINKQAKITPTCPPCKVWDESQKECVDQGLSLCRWQGPLSVNQMQYCPDTHKCCLLSGIVPIDEDCPCNSNSDCEFCLEECRGFFGVFNKTCEPVDNTRICENKDGSQFCIEVDEGECCPNEVTCRWDSTCYPEGHICDCFDDDDCKGSGCEYICDTSTGKCKEDTTKQKCEDGTCVGVNDCCPENRCELGSCNANWFYTEACDCRASAAGEQLSQIKNNLIAKCNTNCRPNCESVNVVRQLHMDCLVPAGGKCYDTVDLVCSCS